MCLYLLLLSYLLFDLFAYLFTTLLFVFGVCFVRLLTDYCVWVLFVIVVFMVAFCIGSVLIEVVFSFMIL